MRISGNQPYSQTRLLWNKLDLVQKRELVRFLRPTGRIPVQDKSSEKRRWLDQIDLCSHDPTYGAARGKFSLIVITSFAGFLLNSYFLNTMNKCRRRR